MQRSDAVYIPANPDTISTPANSEIISAPANPETIFVPADPNTIAKPEKAEQPPQREPEPEPAQSQPPQSSGPDLSVTRLIEEADHSAGKLVNLLAKHFPSFRDEARFDGRRVRFLKRAQIFVADLWAALDGRGYGEFRAT